MGGIWGPLLMALKDHRTTVADLTVLLAEESDYAGRNTFRGLRFGLTLGLLAWLLVIISGFVIASAHDSTGCGAIPLPPSQYDHVPKGTTIVATADIGQVGRTCASMGMGAQTLTGSDSITQGCSW